MKVSELIEKLRAMEPEARVVFLPDGGWWVVETVEPAATPRDRQKFGGSPDAQVVILSY